MEKYQSSNIRNVCLLGHSADGKTTLTEAMLYFTKGTDRFGKVTEGNTVSDYDPEEIKRGFSISASIAPVIWKNTKINFLDTPGYLDFVGEVFQALRVADSALIVCDGKVGVEVGTELAWDNATAAKLPKAIYINKIDDSEARFDRVFDQLKSTFGSSVCPLLIPVSEGDKKTGLVDLIGMSSYSLSGDGKAVASELPSSFADKAAEYRSMLMETIAETDEALMEKFFAEEEITRDEAVAAIHKGFLAGDIVPVICGSAVNMWGIEQLLDTVVDTFPSPLSRPTETVIDAEGAEKTVELSETAPASLLVFKTVADAFVGKVSCFRVMSGTIKNDDLFKNLTTSQNEKFSHIYMLRGKKQIEVDSFCMGDIGMTAKLSATNTNDTLTLAPNALPYKPIVYPESFLQMSISPKAKGDEDKISIGITKLLEEDRTLKYENNSETKQMLISGQGDIHLDVVVSKFKNRFGTSVELGEPKIAYRETVKKKFACEGKHKKQSGGSGQYGHVKITFGPGEAEGLTFTQSVVGGTVPKGYYPAVEKGLLEAMQKGVLAGFPVVNLAADLFDGSYHPVDSNEISFKLAAKLAYKEGVKNAGPVLLEPVGKLLVYIPDSMVGDIIGALNKRRGRVLGMTPTAKKGEQVVEADVPMAEMTDFTIQLRAMSQGRGRFTFYFDRYEEVPAANAQKIIEEAKKDAEEDK